MLTRKQATAVLEENGLGFLANIITTHHRHPVRKLNGAVALVLADQSVRVGETIDHLEINGEVAEWSDLETLNNLH